MKTLKRFFATVIFAVFVTFVSSLDLQGNYVSEDYVQLPEIVVTCSSGIYGRCFAIDWDFCPGYKIDIMYYCRWSGYTSDKCGEFWVKLANWIMDRCTL
ncbi:MAG: hypothetical protein ACUVT3_12745 [Ignavibacterium sp.]